MNKRQILLDFDSGMYSVFVYSHDGDLPVLRDAQGNNPEVAFPLTTLLFGEIDIEKLCDFIRQQYAAHARQDSEVVL